MFRPLSTTVCLALLLALPGAHAALAGTTPSIREPRAAARTAMKADMPYMAAKVRASGKDGIRLNLADDVQYRFLKNRLAAAGKTAKSSPRLFQHIDWLRRHQSLGLELEKTAPERAPLHLLTELSEHGGDLFVEAHSTLAGGSVYTYLDAALWEESGETMVPIGDLGTDEQYGQGTDVFAIAEARTPGDPCAKSFTGDSLKCELDNVGTFGCTYMAGGIPDQCPSYTVSFENPRDRLNDTDTDLIVCLERGGSDCDHYLPVFNQQIRLPLKGTITFSHKIKASATDSTKPELASTGYVNYISLSGDGGGCPALSAADFLAHPNTRIANDGSGKKLVWDIDWANYGSPGQCFKHQDTVYLFFVLPVVVEAPGSNRTVLVSLKPASYAGAHVPNRLSFKFSCLAAGTAVRLGDGTSQAIENIAARDTVRSRVAGPRLASGRIQLVNLPEASLTVVDRSTGGESLPMVRLTTDSGHSLLLTEGHPVFTDRGPVLAKLLQKGDMVLTESGPSRLVEVGREPYGGKVYNLKLGTGDELAAFPGAQASMFANGILVGDGNMQARMQDEANRRPATTLEQIPRAWRQDFRNSRRATAKK